MCLLQSFQVYVKLKHVVTGGTNFQLYEQVTHKSDETSSYGSSRGLALYESYLHLLSWLGYTTWLKPRLVVRVSHLAQVKFTHLNSSSHSQSCWLTYDCIQMRLTCFFMTHNIKSQQQLIPSSEKTICAKLSNMHVNIRNKWSPMTTCNDYAKGLDLVVI